MRHLGTVDIHSNLNIHTWRWCNVTLRLRSWLSLLTVWNARPARTRLSHNIRMNIPYFIVRTRHLRRDHRPQIAPPWTVTAGSASTEQGRNSELIIARRRTKTTAHCDCLGYQLVLKVSWVPWLMSRTSPILQGSNSKRWRTGESWQTYWGFLAVWGKMS